MRLDFKKIFSTRRRLRSTSVPRSLGAAVTEERDPSESFHRAHSYSSYLDNLPIYSRPRSPKMSRAHGNTPPWRPPNSSDMRRIPVRSNENDLYQTYLWFVKPNTPDQIVKVPLGMHDAEFTHTQDDNECKQTKWYVYKNPIQGNSGNPLEDRASPRHTNQNFGHSGSL